MARASEASGARELGDQHTLAEITLAGASAPPGDFDVNDLQIPLGDSAVPRFSSQQLPQDIGFIQLSIQ